MVWKISKKIINLLLYRDDLQPSPVDHTKALFLVGSKILPARECLLNEQLSNNGTFFIVLLPIG